MQVAKDLPGGVSDKKRCSQVVVFELKKKLENNKTEKLPFDETHFMALAAPISLEWVSLHLKAIIRLSHVQIRTRRN